MAAAAGDIAAAVGKDAMNDQTLQGKQILLSCLSGCP